MAVEGGAKCVKYLLYIFVLAFWVCAVALIAVGVMAQLSVNRAVALGETTGSVAPLVIIAVGAGLFLIAFVGCCGTCRESYCLMATFAAFLTLIVLVEVAAAIAGYVFRDKLKSEFEKRFRAQMADYQKSNATRELVDDMQREFNCCGAHNYTDWTSMPDFHSNVPDSCCRNVTQGCGTGFKLKNIYTKGCVETFGGWLRHNVLLFAGVGLGIAFVEVLGIAFSCCLMKSIRSGYEVM
ncbi:CD63 antigen [Tachyglossus aculeatus]|uniref:CD63 antigen n=1 Tax=Tachyglossus aculeatus TaxID=9261 RepID=UPI0018F3ABC5|nr:CD63 antigen [Tachyglossus aculeatus]